MAKSSVVSRAKKLMENRHPVPLIKAEEEPAIDPAEAWRHAEELTGASLRRARAKKHVAITIPEDRPFGISAIADQHIQSDGPTDLKRMREDAALIAATPGLFAMLGGDGVDNHLKHRAAMLASGSRPKRQWMLYDHYLGMFGTGKILGVISGNHDNWTQHFADVDQVANLAKGKRLFYAEDELIATIVAGGFRFRYGLRHQYRFNSAFNPTHSVKRWWEMGETEWDVGVLCHVHEPACEPFLKHGKTRWALRPGSYQYLSGYSRQFGWNPSLPTCPTVIINPRQGTILGLPDVHHAAEYLTWLRQRKGA
jgi:hypothetical protein